MEKCFFLLMCTVASILALRVSDSSESQVPIPVAIVPTQGVPWPMPQSYSSSTEALPVDAQAFIFHATGLSCDVLQEAFVRYVKLTFGNRPEGKTLVFKPRTSAPNAISQLNVDISTPCENTYPSLESDESYTLSVSAGGASLTASEVWGALRGLETFSQIVYQNRNGEFMVNKTQISDHPRFQHRGVLLDTSRHYLSVYSIKRNLDAMAMNKMNVFHWHIVDDQSFPYESVAFPELSNKGAYDPLTHVYTPTNVKDVIEYARLRGIRVIPEFDSPGHTQSWGLGQPGLLTPCYSGSSPDGSFGPVNPTVNSTFTFMAQFLKEVASVFPDHYVHLGGDEVSFSCWESNPDVTKFMDKMGFGSDYAKLEKYYVQNVLDIASRLSKSSMIYEEVVDNGVNVQPDTVVGVWKYHDTWSQEMSNITKLGYKAVLSSCWYLNIINYGTDWPQFYKCDPYDFEGTDAQKKLVMGGEAAIWGEWVDNTNLLSRFWPRASVVAERLWSNATVKDVQAATPRLEGIRCKMVWRGIPAEPASGPSFCPVEFDN